MPEKMSTISSILAKPMFERLSEWSCIGPVQRTMLEEFAESIVRKCARIADDADEAGCEWIGGNVLMQMGVFCLEDLKEISIPNNYESTTKKVQI